ncbi:hypothetical protein P3X46_030948 [Hevea brasiliensis]|uniref:G-patch domain-containing protein n=1 Tax=Hevea brasiliensis TaxID=3981 RepID=A0ABQ9KKM7_HEVBR|nr:uncharacterized protein LOC110642584 isoform X2 [Hevea brasiliensis]KAJ9140282.1 hypothetical protein P3X46_030948 [Hevea brasiliensis]
MEMETDMEMEESKETDSQSQATEGDDCSFVWDETTRLYFHASTGFYHDPTAGWYYSSRDGLYYKFENGSYVLLEFDKVNAIESHSSPGIVPDNSVQDESSTQFCCHSEENVSSLPMDQSDAYPFSETVPDESALGEPPCMWYTKCTTDQPTENPPPPSEWLEETLINLYLSGYNQVINNVDVSAASLEVNGGDSLNCSADGASNDDTQMLKDGDWISEHHCKVTDECESTIDKDASRDEENWQAQYGEVVHSREQPVQDIRAVDLWDWAKITGFGKDGKGQTTRLVGRLVKQSAKLHPSMPSSGSFFRTAPICEAHLDLVRVRTGQVYKLHSPCARYLASLSSYDSANPTKDWGVPELSMNIQYIPLTKSSEKSELKLADEDTDCKGMFTSPSHHSISKKQRIYEYRDRAAERRNFHGGFGVGPGQKSTLVDEVCSPSSPVSTSTENAAAEALNMSFGTGSYARKMLEKMGWKEGEGLGNTRKGLIKPLQAVGNVGNAGVGWPGGRMTE